VPLTRVGKLVFWGLAWCFYTIFMQAVIKFWISYCTTPVATFTTKSAATATTAVTITTFTVDGMPVINSEAMLFEGIVVKEARNRPRMVEVCAEGACEKRWAALPEDIGSKK
jgi:TPP-dependent pyruvate/acetoin dehydrogenase alpha subunit